MAISTQGQIGQIGAGLCFSCAVTSIFGEDGPVVIHGGGSQSLVTAVISLFAPRSTGSFHRYFKSKSRWCKSYHDTPQRAFHRAFTEGTPIRVDMPCPAANVVPV